MTQEKLRIGMIAPITHPVPPPGYGPWERVVYDLVETLVAFGHDVTLFAAAGSHTSGRLVAPNRQGGAGVDDRWFDPGPDPRVLEQLHIATAVETAATERFDVLHAHLHVHSLVFSRLSPAPMVTTLHGAAWNRAHHPALLAYKEQPFVSISDAERDYLPDLRYVATVHNGIAVDDFAVGAGAAGHLLFAGRLAPEKAPDLAIEAARIAGRPLVIAGMVEDAHRAFFDERVRPALVDQDVEYVGDLNRIELIGLYGSAAATIVPLRWDEPFGLVSVESMATGTPVIAWRRGALPEIVEEGTTGFVVADAAEAAIAVNKVGDLDRGACRVAVERRFSRETMAHGYEGAYRRVLATV